MTTSAIYPLKTYRLKRGFTQDELARLAGVRHSTVGRVERGLSVNVKTMHKLAQALGVEPEEISEFHQQIYPDPARSRPDPTPTTEAG